MSRTALNIAVIPKRMLTKSEAADYASRSVRQLEAECPVKPIQFQNGDRRYDLRDLDQWLDNLKAGNANEDAASILARL
jgi:hypothetical protein